MNQLEKFSEWMNQNSKQLSESSIYKYSRAINTISNEMLEEQIISKNLFDMNRTEIDLAIAKILQNQRFINKNTVGNSMYSNALKQFRYYSLFHEEEAIGEKVLVQEILSLSSLKETEKDTIVKARKGQGKYREGLIQKYEGKCILTGIDHNKLLIASHIKPWAICDNEERIDTENGLLLSATMDKLFDNGLITFGKEGNLFISEYVSEENRIRLNLSKDLHVDLRASNRLLKYLEYHRDVLFVK